MIKSFDLYIRGSRSRPYWYVQFNVGGFKITTSLFDAIERARNLLDMHKLNKYVVINYEQAFDITDDDEVLQMLMLYSDC